jgi:predicted alpha/beta-hydrolase family hydrolase
MAKVEPYAVEGVSGFLHVPDTPSGDGLVLTHGAGGNCNAPLLATMATAFCDRGFHVLRCDLPFRQRRPSGPPAPSTATADREGLRLAVAAIRTLAPARIVMGGQSYGGRQATMVAAETPELVDALLLFSYPLHPPGKPERSRTEHFPRLAVPCVFVHGTADPFGSIAELRDAVTLIPAATELIPIASAGHDLKRGRFDLGPVLKAVLDTLARATPRCQAGSQMSRMVSR